MMRSRVALAGCVLLAAAIVTHILELYQFTSFEFDKMNHVAATRSWLEDRGFTIASAGPHGPLDRRYAPLLGFPPGYGFALAPVLAATGDVLVAPFLLDAVAVIVFLASWVALAYRIDGRPWLHASVLMGLWAIVYGPITTATYADLLAAALFTCGLGGGLAAVKSRPRAALVWGVVSGALVGASCATRYAYWPLIIVAPGALLVVRRDRHGRAAAVASLAVAAAGVGLTAWFMSTTTGESTFLARWYPPSSRGFFFPQLLRMYPFPAAAFGVDRVLGRVALGHAPLQRTLPVILWLASAYVLVVVLSHLWRFARAAVRRQCSDRAVYVWVAGVATTVVTIGMLVAMSVRLPAVPDGWTVVMEGRYYLPVLPFIALWFVAAVLGPCAVMPAVRASAILFLGVLVVGTAAYRAARAERYFAENRSTSWMAETRRADARRLASVFVVGAPSTQPSVFVNERPKWRSTIATMSGALVVEPRDDVAVLDSGCVFVAVPAGTSHTFPIWRVAKEHGDALVQLDGATIYRWCARGDRFFEHGPSPSAAGARPES